MLVEPTRSRNDITGGVKLRPVRNRSTVKKDLTAAGARYHFWSFSKTFFPTLDNFAKLPEAPYRVIMDKISELADENLICRVRLGDPGEITRLSERDFSAIPIERWQDCLAGTTLNLIKLWTLAPLVDKTASPPPAIGNGLTAGTKHLVGITYTATSFREALRALPAGSNPDEIFEAVRPFLSGLNADNILAYMPTGERDQTTGQRKWTRRVCLTDPRFQKLIDNDTRWEDGVTQLLQPQLSVASSSSKRDVFVVDIDDEKTFTEQGLTHDQEVLAGYRSKTARVKGCRREMMYIRLWQTRERKKVIGVVALHKFVPVPRPGDPELKVEPFLPDPRGLTGEKHAHALAQRKVTIHQIEAIFTDGLAPYLASALAEAEEVTPLPVSVVSRRKVVETPRRGAQSVIAEEKKKPTRPKPAIFLYLYSVYKNIGVTIRNLYKAMPRDYKTIRKYYNRQNEIIGERGVKQFFIDMFSSVPKSLAILRDFSRFILPRVLPAKPGSFAFLVHPRDMEDVYRVFPATRYLPQPIVFEWLKYLPPIAVSKMTGLSFLNRDEEIDGRLLAMMVTPQHMIEHAESGNKEMIGISAISLGLFAQKLGIAFAGLGALLPSVTRYGTILREFGVKIGLTTGHAFTSLSIANMAIEVNKVINKRVDPNELIAVVGAAGSTGSASARVLVDKGMKKLLLIDLPEKKDKLLQLKQELLELNPDLSEEDIVLSYELSDISKVRIIVTVTNSPKAIIKEEWLRPGQIYIDDAQPPNVAEELALRRQDICVLKVLADVPNLNPGFDFGLGTLGHITFTCLAEVAAFARTGWADDFLLGWPSLDQIHRVEDVTQRAGILLPEVFYGYKGIKYTDENLQETADTWQQAA